MESKTNSEFKDALKKLKKSQKEKKKVERVMDEISEIRKDVDRVFSKVHEGEQMLKQHDFFSRKQKSDIKKIKLSPEKSGSSNGKFVNKGIDDSQREPFDPDEQKYLDSMITEFKSVNKLDYDCLRYLVCQKYLTDLKGIKEGKIKSKIHDDYIKRGVKAKSDLLADMRTSLFTNDQIDYINGLLQGIFSTTEKDNKGDIKHREIDYCLIVMFTEATIRIVKHVHKFRTLNQAQNFIIRSADDSIEYIDE